jgi:hypothetical protein
MHFLFGFLIFLYFLIRFSTRSARRSARRNDQHDRLAGVLQDLVSQNGGDAYQVSYCKRMYVTRDRSVELQLDTESRRLVLRLRKSFPIPVSFYRLPRLVYAFLEAFLQPTMKVEGTHYLIGSRNAELLSELKVRNGFIPLLQRLDRAGFSGQVSRYGLKLWRNVDPAEIHDVTLLSYIRMAQDLGQLCDPDVITIPVQRLSSDNRCAYCKEHLAEVDPVQYCQWCGTPHHKDCFELNGRCTVFGCQQPIPGALASLR